MSERIPKRVVGGYYIWQWSAYGSKDLDADEPADIYKVRLTPTTPQGDFVYATPSARAADELLDRIKHMGLSEARSLAKALYEPMPGSELCDPKYRTSISFADEPRRRK